MCGNPAYDCLVLPDRPRRHNTYRESPHYLPVVAERWILAVFFVLVDLDLGVTQVVLGASGIE
ncbi:hypothetical protein D9M70_639050 [compost metagenome]